MTSNRPTILYIGDLAQGATALHRLEALRSFGLNVVGLDHNRFNRSRIRGLDGLKRRFPFWPATRGYGRAVLALAQNHDPAIVWFDKPTLMSPAVLRELRGQGRFTVHHTVDDATGRASEPYFRNILACIPDFDLNLVSRQISLEEYRARGARDVRYFQLAHDDDLHRPPPSAWTDVDRPVDVMFIGSAHDDRPAFLERLWREQGIACHILGDAAWRRALSRDAAAALLRGPPVWQQDYVNAIWSAKICLSFVTRINRDDLAHRSFELAACGACVVAERSAAQELVFEPNREMAFFSSIEECAGKIKELLDDPERRAEIGAEARKRALRDGYGNRKTIERVLREIARSRPGLGLSKCLN